jgi:glycosyltransferase involved in cell wall biosynthesis
MKISVITVCYNAEKTIGRTIASFLSQDHVDAELIVIDGASTDGTLQVVNSFADPRIRVLSEPDTNMYDALNKGLKLCRGAAIGVLNADDAYHDAGVLDRISRALEKCDIVHGHLDFMDATGKVVRRWRAGRKPRGGFATGWMPAHPTFYVRREVAEYVGQYDTGIATAADYDWMLRAVDLNRFRLGLIDHVMIDMAMGGKSTSGLRSFMQHNIEALVVRRRWLGAGLVDFALFAKPARKIGQLIPHWARAQ